MLRRPGGVARADGGARPSDGRRTCGRRSRPGAQALQVFDSWAGALDPDDYARYVLPVMRGRVRRAGRPRRAADPLRRRAPASCWRCMRDAGGDVVGVDWRVPLDDAWERVGSSDVRGAGQPRPGRAAWRRGRWWRRRRSTCCGAPAAAPGTCSTWATACCRRPRRRRCERLVDLVHERTARRKVVTRTDRRAGDGVRHGQRARRHRAVLHRHPRRPRADARAPAGAARAVRGDRQPVPAAGDRRAQAAAHRGGAEPGGRRRRVPVVPRDEALAAVHRRGRRADAGGRRRAGRRARDGAALVRDVGRDLRRAGARSRSRSAGGSSSRTCGSGRPSGVRRVPGRSGRDALGELPSERIGRPLWSSPRTACRTRTVRGRDDAVHALRPVPGRVHVRGGLRETADLVAERSGSESYTIGVAERGAHGRPVAGARRSRT